MASSPDGWPDDDEDVRWPLVAKLGVALAAITLIGGLGAAVVAAFFIDRSDDPEPLIVQAVDPVAPVAMPGGGFLYGERTTGRVVAVDADGNASEFAQVPDGLETDGQRGLLGMAVRVEGDSPELYGSWTSDDGALVVGRLAPGPAEVIWQGPLSTDVANGGTLAFRGRELIIGIGELQAPELVDDPTTPNGKILALDPDGPADQEPAVVAGGFHNPFAIAVVGGDIWVADNAPGSAPERLVRVAPDGSIETLELEGRRAPSGLAADAEGDLLLCGFVSGVVERIPVPETGVRGPAGKIDDLPCATGVAVLADGSIVTTSSDAVWRR